MNTKTGTQLFSAPSTSPGTPGEARGRPIAFEFVVRALARIRRPERPTTNPKHAKCHCPEAPADAFLIPRLIHHSSFIIHHFLTTHR
jgi:hypothetical protein